VKYAIQSDDKNLFYIFLTNIGRKSGEKSEYNAGDRDPLNAKLTGVDIPHPDKI
jgi:hypothetical protein